MSRAASLGWLTAFLVAFALCLTALVALGIVAVWTVDPTLRDKLGGTCGVIGGLAFLTGFIAFGIALFRSE